MQQDSHPRQGGRGLLEELEPLATRFGLEILKARDIAAWPRDIAHKASPRRPRYLYKHNRDCFRQRLQLGDERIGHRCYYIWRSRDDFDRDRLVLRDTSASPSDVEPNVTAIVPAKARKCLYERRETDLPFQAALREAEYHGHPPHGLLRPRRKREPRRQRAADKGYERAPFDLACPGCGAVRVRSTSGAPLIRDRSIFGVRYGPGSAAHHFAALVLRRARDTSEPSAADYHTLEISNIEGWNNSSTVTLRSISPCSWAYWASAVISRIFSWMP